MENLTFNKQLTSIFTRGAMRHLSHETRQDMRLDSRERDKIFKLFFLKILND